MGASCTATCLLPVLMVTLMLLLSGHIATAQRSPFSLQAAVDELHRRDAAKYPLNAPPSQHYLGTSSDQDYWDEDTEYPAKTESKSHNRRRLNKALAKYLERENYEAEHGGLSLGPFGLYEFDDINNSNNYGNGDGAHDGGENRLGLFGVGVVNKARNKFLSNVYNEEKKRSPSVFRERDNKFDNVPASVFRERESESPIVPDHSELAEQFLREIEETQEREREENYKDALRNLWEKYQRQENEIDDDLFEEKKRVRTPPYYMLMAKKRSYPVLPWLPYSADRKKRFPVSKRSAKRSTAENLNFGKTDEKVARELKELFGEPIEEKRKRSTDVQAKAMSTDMPSTAMAEMRLEVSRNKGNDSSEGDIATTASTEVNHEHDHKHEHDHSQHSQKEHKHRKRSESGNDESYEDEDEDSDEAEGHDEHDEEEDDHEDFDDDEEEHKKKRSVALKKRSTRSELSFRRKKSVEWSKYFGIDRKKKAYHNNKLSLTMKKRNADCDEEDEVKKKRDIDPEKLENMDKKLHSIEDFIIDETIKYTGAHEGINKPDEIRRLKDRVLSRLATAYSLEKMRRALEKLRQSVEKENHLLRNMIESEDSDDTEAVENQKRLSVKKETAEPHHDNDQLSAEPRTAKAMHSNALPSDNENNDENNNNAQGDEMKKKRKRNGYIRYPELPNEFADADEELGAVRYESLNDAYLGNKNYMLGSNQCPLIEAMADRCRGVDLLSGDLNQELLPICGVHQICYLCGTSQVSCDYQYLTDADAICGPNKDCQAAARSVLMILRGSPGPQLGPRECLKKPCLYSVMREIGM